MKVLILIFGVICGSTAGAFIRLASAPSPVLVVYRMFFSLVLLAPMVWLHRKEFSAMARKTLLLCICSGMSLGLHFVTYFESVKNTSLAASSVLVNMEVLFVALATVLIFHRKLSGKAWLAVLLAFGGAVIIALSDTGSGGSGNAILGDALALISACFMAAYTLLGSVCRKNVTTTIYTYLVYFVAMVTVLILTIVSGTPLFGYGRMDFVASLGMALLPTLLGHSVFSWCLKYLPPAMVSTMRQMDPLFAALWGFLLFGEWPGILVLLGGAIIICGAVLYSRTSARENKEN